MFFIFLIFMITLSIASSAAFFSVFGLAHLFTGAMVPVIIMGATLEAGKLVAASFLYREWKKINFFIKMYLMAAIIVLMTITSLGIFGYLTAAYQTDSIPIKEISHTLETKKTELTRLLERKEDIDIQISQLPNNYVTARQRLMKSFKPELDKIVPEIETLQKEISELQSKQLTTEAHIGPIIFVAKALHREPDDAVFWFTLLIMVVFDPLAVVLTIATNMSIKNYKESKKINKTIVEEIVQPIIPESSTQIISKNDDNVKETIVDSSTSNNNNENIETIVQNIINSRLEQQDKKRKLLEATRK